MESRNGVLFVSQSGGDKKWEEWMQSLDNAEDVDGIHGLGEAGKDLGRALSRLGLEWGGTHFVPRDGNEGILANRDEASGLPPAFHPRTVKAKSFLLGQREEARI